MLAKGNAKMTWLLATVGSSCRQPLSVIFFFFFLSVFGEGRRRFSIVSVKLRIKSYSLVRLDVIPTIRQFLCNVVYHGMLSREL